MDGTSGSHHPNGRGRRSLLSRRAFLGRAALVSGGLGLASGLLAGRMPRRLVWTLVWMLPVFIVSILVCTKAWVDGLLGRPCRWIKTQRSASRAMLEPAIR